MFFFFSFEKLKKGWGREGIFHFQLLVFKRNLEYRLWYYDHFIGDMCFLFTNFNYVKVSIGTIDSSAIFYFLFINNRNDKQILNITILLEVSIKQKYIGIFRKSNSYGEKIIRQSKFNF